MDNRANLAELLEECLERANFLAARALSSTTTDQTQVKLQAIGMVSGARVLHGLKTIRAVLPLRLDDQIAILARSMVDAALDLEYVRHPTVRRRKKRPDLILSVDIKFELFLGHRWVSEYVLTGAVPEERMNELCSALARRDQLRIGTRTTWHGATTKDIVGELLEKPRDGKLGERVELVYGMFRLLSLFVHPGPVDGPFLEQSDAGPFGLKIRDQLDAPELVGAGVIGATDVLVAWGELLGEELHAWGATVMTRIMGHEGE